ncbi:hypothetical protein [Pontixanthobacter luteolus]|uniref:hypothetical protein n=1 Tax=Pontixanthobacter luteolus TaxID=295089 RepID=UPI00230333E4|nr:hypothetical protein [Pontixanthobacter luteolus]
MTRFKTFSAAAALTASLAMAASPVAAANIGVQPAAVSIPVDDGWSEAEESGDYYRRYRHRRHRGVDAGDVIAGVLILGGIAAVASAASNNSRNERRYPAPPPRYPDNDRRSNSGQGIDRAVDMCLSEIERDVRVDSVDSVDRSGDGWRVTGRIYNGEGFTCRIGNDGAVDGITYGGRSAALGGAIEDRQWSDDRYTSARARSDSGNAPVYSDDKLPAYPGGPIDGDQDEDGETYGG